MTEQTAFQFSQNDLTWTRSGHLGESTDPDWLVENIWALNGCGMMVGRAKRGKTWLLVDLVVSIASGTKFLERFPCLQGPVMIYSPEGNDIRKLDRRIEIMKERKGLAGHNLPLFLGEKKRKLNLLQTFDQNTVENTVKQIKPALIVFDPLRECWKGDEKDSTQFTEISDFAKYLCKEYRTAVLICHHIKKDKGATLWERMSGTGAMFSFGESYIGLDVTASDKTFFCTEQRHGERIDCLPLEKVKGGGWAIGKAFKEAPKKDLGTRVLELLKKTKRPMSVREMREAITGANSSFTPRLTELKDEGKVRKIKGLWRLVKPKKNAKKKK